MGDEKTDSSEAKALVSSDPNNDPELIFAIVRAIGTDSAPVLSEITALLQDAQYKVSTVQLSDRFKDINFLSSTLKNSPENERYETYMNAGDLLRSVTQRADAAAVLGIKGIIESRGNFIRDRMGTSRGRSYILKSLMHPKELETLRRVYGTQLFVVAVFAPRDIRVRRLAKSIADSWGEQVERWTPSAEELVNRDVGIPKSGDAVAQTVPAKYVIDVQKTFHRADLFISATAPDDSAAAVTRFVELIFGHPFHTP